MEFAPVAITQVNWPAYDDVCKRHLGYAPIKQIDGSQLQLSDPAAYLSTLTFSDPLQTLRATPHHTFRHYHVTFAGVLSSYDTLNLSTQTALTVTMEELKRGECFVMVTGNVLQWVDFSVKHSQANSDLRPVANQVYIKFKQAGFRELFTGYSTSKLGDGSFVIQ